MDYGDVFKRYEIKYLITEEQKKRIDDAIAKYGKPDRYGQTSIRNIYYDTPDFRLIRRSLDKPDYKEKLRVRAYGTPKEDGEVFVELKKKYNSVTYKRRIKVTEAQAVSWLAGGGSPADSQIAREIDYALAFYKELVPAVYISYERQAFVGVNEKDFRITFDKEIRWRRTDLSLLDGAYGETILPEGYTLMELKTAQAFPLWFTKVLTECRLYSTHFSKYGSAYTQLVTENRQLYGTTAASRKIIYPSAKGEIIYA